MPRGLDQQHRIRALPTRWNSSSRWVTHSDLSLGMPLLEELQWCEIAKGLVRAHGVVGFLPLASSRLRAAISREHSVTW